MQLNHLDLPVPDVALAAAFFQTAFGFRCLESRGRDGMAILQGDGGFVLVLTRTRPTQPPQYPERFHLGFLLDSEQAVRDTWQRLADAGAHPPEAPRAMRGGFMFYCHAPGGILVEVSHRAAGSGD